MPKCQKVILNEPPFASLDTKRNWFEQGKWPARWISVPDADKTTSAWYRNDFTLPQAYRGVWHVAADVAYLLFLDGKLLWRGGERGDALHWYFDSLQVELEPGKHRLEALVLGFGTPGICSQITVHHGFLLDSEDDQGELFRTSKTNYTGQKIDTFKWRKNSWVCYIGGELSFDYAAYRQVCEAETLGPVVELEQGVNNYIRNEYGEEHLLENSHLPALVDRPIAAMPVVFVSEQVALRVQKADDLPDQHDAIRAALEKRAALTVAPHSVKRILVLLDNYYTFQPYFTVSGGKGGSIELGTAEGLFVDEKGLIKNARNDFWDKIFRGYRDEFLPDGGDNQHFFLHHYRAGLYVELIIRTADQALTLTDFELREERYDWELQSQITLGDKAWDDLVVLYVRTMQMCAHDIFMDCPYYEQLMYIGDLRLELLTTYVSTLKAQPLVEKALTLLSGSRLPWGLTVSRYPAKVTQVIPPFSLLFVALLRDYVLYVGGEKSGEYLSIGRQIMDTFDQWLQPNGLLDIKRTWNFVDWTKEWYENGRFGEPFGARPEDQGEVSGVINLLYVYTLSKLAEGCMADGQTVFADYYLAKAKKQLAKVIEVFYQVQTGLFADTLDGKHYSEHAQILAILSNLLPPDIEAKVAANLFNDTVAKSRSTIYFNYYYFAACAKHNRMDKFFERLTLWRDLPQLGLRTLLESPEPSRSDCHAWSSNPLYHYFSSICGIKPTAKAFAQVEIAPHPGHLSHLKCQMVHSQGELKLDLTFDAKGAHGQIELPGSVSGNFIYASQRQKLTCGVNLIDC